MNHRHTVQTLSAAGELRVRPPQHFQAPALFPGTPLSAVFCAVFGPYPRRAGLCVGTRLAFRSLLLPSEHVLLPQHHRNGPAELTLAEQASPVWLHPPTPHRWGVLLTKHEEETGTYCVCSLLETYLFFGCLYLLSRWETVYLIKMRHFRPKWNKKSKWSSGKCRQ